MIKISLISPIKKDDYLTNTVIEGLSILENEGIVSFTISSRLYNNHNIKSNNVRHNREDFKKDLIESDIIILCYSKSGTDRSYFEDDSLYKKTVFLDGSELGGNNRLNRIIQRSIIDKTWQNNGRIDTDLLGKCALYLRREKPYIDGIVPFPFGIENKYISYRKGIIKDIDFLCIFGQDKFPPLRKEVKDWLYEYCKNNNLKCIVKKTKNREEFYNLLARSKVGVSVSGGGYDTARFWEILANNCILLTEKIDIYNKEDNAFDFKDNIYEFSNLEDFKERVFELKDKINIFDFRKNENIYKNILERHSTKSRVEHIIKLCKDRSIII